MSRVLPEHPNLDHLRNQAKDLLRELQQQNPGSKLADAQHAIARDYGFASWPTLKAHVESLQKNPFVGHWTANVSKSKRHPANQFQSARIRIAVDGDTVTFDDVFVSDSGQEEHGENNIQADGRERPSGSAGYVAVARWLGSHVLEIVRMKDGEIEVRATYEVSADGRTLTISGPGQVIVLDRRR